MHAAIDIGSNTIEVLVARCLPDGLEIIEHQTTMVRLGKSVNESGEISRDKLDAARQYKELAQQHGAEQILAIATEAMREARNSKDFLDMLSCLIASHKLDVILKVSFTSLITCLAGQRIL